MNFETVMIQKNVSNRYVEPRENTVVFLRHAISTGSLYAISPFRPSGRISELGARFIHSLVYAPPLQARIASFAFRRQ